MAARGLFVTLEGGEGAGKSTQARLLTEALRAEGHDVFQTREPGGTPGAEAIRELLLFGKVDLSWRAEVLMHMAARADHLDHQILPALDRGAIVVCDRFHDSTLAYQGYGVGEGRSEVLSFIGNARHLIDREPDLTLMLELSRDVASARLQARGGQTDRYEGQASAFHERVKDGFDAIARSDPDRIRRIDAGRAPGIVCAALLRAVHERLAEGGA